MIIIERTCKSIIYAFDDINSDDVTLIHGGCRGLDELAAKCAKQRSWQVLTIPADWNLYGKAAGPIRNGQILDMSPRLVLLFHNDIEKSKGTKNMMSQCMARNIPYLLYKS